MKSLAINFLAWQNCFGTEETCSEALPASNGRKDLAARVADTSIAKNVRATITKPR